MRTWNVTCSGTMLEHLILSGYSDHVPLESLSPSLSCLWPRPGVGVLQETPAATDRWGHSSSWTTGGCHSVYVRGRDVSSATGGVLAAESRTLLRPGASISYLISIKQPPPQADVHLVQGTSCLVAFYWSTTSYWVQKQTQLHTRSARLAASHSRLHSANTSASLLPREE